MSLPANKFIYQVIDEPPPIMPSYHITMSGRAIIHRILERLRETNNLHEFLASIPPTFEIEYGQVIPDFSTITRDITNDFG